ncbi:PBSX family phage terminase large subunit [Caldicoprobacter algeriensis]|uniref:PBSX family phage terminase large subunit n=1 Tax=Caldicoprobacter algeriensis TaxID=699281 RepID=UPI002079454C|nr:PBSX family phage terminase large subunit [Caldicoprobacter algeriensis]MCM8901315.1 PBSX family phage terminase large subunit [Caldicoprobacter algeriensis]
MIVFSTKQKEFVRLANKKLNIAYGSVRTGKTIITTIAFLLHVVGFKQKQHFAIVGKTRDTVRRNVIPVIEQYLGKDSFTYTITRDEIEFLGHKIFVLGANDEKAETRIRGLTLAGALCDEVTTYPRSVFEQLLARCSVKGAKVFATTNPDSPYHWLYTEYIQKADEKDYFVMKFLLEDNPFLPSEYIEFIKKTYTGLFYKRFILGEWVAAEGIIYDMFDEKVHVVERLPERFDKYVVGIDFGMQNPTVFLLIGFHNGIAYVVKEYYHEGREQTKTVDKYSKDFKEWLGDIKPHRIYVDPSAQALLQQLKADGFSNVREANNDVLDGIATVSKFLSQQKLFVHSSCKNTIREFYSYAWDTKAQQNGQDKPLKIADHCMDALRYALHSQYPIGQTIQRRVIDKPKGW